MSATPSKPRPVTASAASSALRGKSVTISLSPTPVQQQAKSLLPSTLTTSPPPPSGPSSALERLHTVRESLALLNETIERGADAKRGSVGSPSQPGPLSHPGGGSDTRLMEIKEAALRIEQHLAIEVKRRAEADRQLADMLDERSKQIAAMVEKRVNERLVAMHHAVDLLTHKVKKLNEELAVEREKNVHLTEELRFHASRGLQDIRSMVDQERTQRLEKQAMLSNKLAEDIARIQERLDVERHARETMLAATREDLAKSGKTRDKTDERTLASLREQLMSLRSELQSERGVREHGEEHLAVTMEEVVKQVQLGLQSLAK